MVLFDLLPFFLPPFLWNDKRYVRFTSYLPIPRRGNNRSPISHKFLHNLKNMKLLFWLIYIVSQLQEGMKHVIMIWEVAYSFSLTKDGALPFETRLMFWVGISEMSVLVSGGRSCVSMIGISHLLRRSNHIAEHPCPLPRAMGVRVSDGEAQMGAGWWVVTQEERRRVGGLCCLSIRTWRFFFLINQGSRWSEKI